MSKNKSGGMRPSSDTALFTAQEINAFHGQVADRIDQCVGQSVVIKDPVTAGRPATDVQPWENCHDGARLSFQAITKEGHPEFAQPKWHSGRCVIIRLTPRSPARKSAAWIAWTEQWDKQVGSGGKFHPVGFSIMFFWGSVDNPQDRTQILRAEWDHPKKRGENSAQPHWHIDPDLLDFGRGEPATSETPVESLTAANLDSPVAVYSLKAMHLGMGGWIQPGGNPPGSYWQYTMQPPQLTDCLNWLTRTLEYMAVELDKLSPSASGLLPLPVENL